MFAPRRYDHGMTDSVTDLLTFIDASPTPYHAVEQLCARLEAQGFSSLDEADAWALAPGAKRYVVRGQGSLLAFEVGEAPPTEEGFRLLGAHTDSPVLRLKPCADRTQLGYRQLAVETYGGLLLHTWLDRDLSLAGRVFYDDGKSGLGCALIDFRRALLRIPNLAIHLYSELRQEGLKLNPQRHMVPIVGLESAPDLAELLAEELRSNGPEDCKELRAESIRSYDLLTYDLQASSRWGANEELIAAPRLDNLASCHAGISALLESSKQGRVPFTRVLIFNDHEEVGSRSALGAQGTFLSDVLGRIAEGLGGGSAEALPRAIAKSWLISADMAHAVHPNYADRHEPGHRPVLGGGPVIKANANLSYATDGEGVGFFTALCEAAGCVPQHFVTRSDLGCGSTIGPITAAALGVRTVDVGSPMLSMHSCRETASAADVESMIAVLTAYFQGVA
jgi:aspartyl aminopeptidase